MSKDSNFTIISVSISADTKVALTRVLADLDLSQSEFLRLAIASVIERGTPPEVSPRARHRSHVPSNHLIVQGMAAAV